MDNKTKIKTRFLALAKQCIEVNLATKALIPQYDKLFKEVLEQSTKFNDYLKLWSTIEQQMPLNLSEAHKQTLKELQHIMLPLTSRTTIAMTEVLAKEKQILFVIENVHSTEAEIRKVYPTFKDCNQVMDVLEQQYKTVEAIYQQMKEELLALQQLMQASAVKFSELNN